MRNGLSRLEGWEKTPPREREEISSRKGSVASGVTVDRRVGLCDRAEVGLDFVAG